MNLFNAGSVGIEAIVDKTFFFKLSDKETFIIENAKESILKELKDTFAPVIDESIRQVNEIRFVLIQLHNETRFLNEKTVLGIC